MKLLVPSAVAIFCEDIRTEQDQQNTIVGTMPDNLQVGVAPGVLPKLAVYVRATFDPAQMPTSFETILRFSDGRELSRTPFDAAALKQSAAQTLKQGTPVASVLTRIVASPFPITAAGQVLAIVEIDGEEFTVGSLNIEVVTT